MAAAPWLVRTAGSGHQGLRVAVDVDAQRQPSNKPASSKASILGGRRGPHQEPWGLPEGLQVTWGGASPAPWPVTHTHT